MAIGLLPARATRDHLANASLPPSLGARTGSRRPAFDGGEVGKEGMGLRRR
jgi:hypothetical protein